MPSKKTGIEKELVRFEYEYAHDFKEFYVTGAKGQIQNIYHLRLDFYSEMVKIKSMSDSLIESKKGVRLIKPTDPWRGPEIVERTFKIGLNLSFNAVKELSNYLIIKVKEIEEIEERLNAEKIDNKGDE